MLRILKVVFLSGLIFLAAGILRGDYLRGNETYLIAGAALLSAIWGGIFASIAMLPVRNFMASVGIQSVAIVGISWISSLLLFQAMWPASYDDTEFLRLFHFKYLSAIALVSSLNAYLLFIPFTRLNAPDLSSWRRKLLYGGYLLLLLTAFSMLFAPRPELAMSWP